MISNTICNDIQRKIIESEGLLDSHHFSLTQQAEIREHLADCQGCKSLLDEERRLTELLNADRGKSISVSKTTSTRRESRWATSVTAIGAAIMLMACGAFITHAWYASSNALVSVDNPVRGDSFGLMISRPAFTDVNFTTETSCLRDSNHIELSAGSAATIKLNGAGTIDAVGPAIFGVDRVSEQWKLTLLAGQLKVVVNPDSQIDIAGTQGNEQLGPGVHLINFGGKRFIVTGSDRDDPQEQEDELAEKLERGLSVFQANSNATEEDQKAAAKTLSDVFNDRDATAAQRMSAGMYGVAALSNTGQFEKVIEMGTRWEQEFGSELGEVVAATLIKANFALGKTDEAKRRATLFMETFPESSFRPMVESLLDHGLEGDHAPLGTGHFQPDLKPPYVDEQKSESFINEQKSGYLVVQVGLSSENPDHQEFATVASKVQRFHDAQMIDFDGDDFQALRLQIAQHKPANVMFVIPPELLDVNFHRQIFKLAPTLDNDLFADFAWGYLTARNGDVLEEFWQRIKGLHENGMANNHWLDTGVIGGDNKSHVVENGISEWSVNAGFRGDQLYFGCIEKDPDVLKFINDHQSDFENASVIAMTGNGDPQGIWLFDGMRNMDESLHWNFDKAKVGQDPNNEMVRLKSDWFRNLQLRSPVIWSGTCHSGACYRVYVEGDIVSTFGKSDRAVVYDLPRDESLCLSLIDGGAGALLVPIAANHGLAVTLEGHFALKHGATLGETIKSTYDDVILQAGGIPKLLITREGDEPSYFGEPIMQSGGANRILIGDPALRLFKKTQIEIEDEIITPHADKKAMKVQLIWEKGYHGSAWNLFADGRGGEQRMNTRIDCTEMKSLIESAREGNLKVTAKILDAEGKSVPCTPLVELEMIGGRSFLHLQASANDKTLAHSEHRAVFDMTW